MLQDINKEAFFERYWDRLTEKNTKLYKLNDCQMDNEDWVLLNE
jgi:hypothetical protein